MYLFSARNVVATLTSLTVTAWLLWLNLDIGLYGRWPLGILTVATLAAGIWWVVDTSRESAHADEAEDFAARFGWSYMSAGGEWSRKLLRYPFGIGSRRRDTAILRGEFAGMPCATFVHEFEFRAEGYENVPQVFQVTTVQLPFPLSSVDIVPEDAWARTAKFLGGQDIEFESEEFNRNWRVKSGNAKFAHDVIHPRMMERLNRFDSLGLAIRIEGDTVLCWQAGRQPVDNLAKRLSVLCGVARLIPEFVYNEYIYAYEAARARITEVEEAAPDWARTPGRLTDGKYNPELLDPKYSEKLPEVKSGPRLDRSVSGYFPFGFFAGGAVGFDDFGGGGL